MKPPRRRQRFGRPTRDERGQAALELLLVFPVFIVIVLLAVDFGVWMFESVSVANAVRDGVRYASVNCGVQSTDESCTASLIAEYTAEHSSGSLDSASVHVSWPDGGTIGTDVVVAACKSYSMLFVPVTFSTGLASSADMRLELDASSTAGSSTC